MSNGQKVGDSVINYFKEFSAALKKIRHRLNNVDIFIVVCNATVSYERIWYR
jgi:hypothetical protein